MVTTHLIGFAWFINDMKCSANKGAKCEMHDLDTESKNLQENCSFCSYAKGKNREKSNQINGNN